jgi:hypothetical protein
VLAGALAFAFAACDDPSALPGTALGTFSVTAKSASNTCGTALGLPDPWTFDAKMSKDGTKLYWNQADAQIYSGDLDSAGTTATITATSSSLADDAGFSPCVIGRTDTLKIVLDNASTPSSVSGTIAFAFQASSANDCAMSLAVNGGTFQTLPCNVAYQFTGTKQSP